MCRHVQHSGLFVFYSFQGLAVVQTARMSFKEFQQRLDATDEMSQRPLVLKNQLRQVLQRYMLMQKWILKAHTWISNWPKIFDNLFPFNFSLAGRSCCSYMGDVATCYSMVSLVHVASTSLSMALCLFISTVVSAWNSCYTLNGK